MIHFLCWHGRITCHKSCSQFQVDQSSILTTLPRLPILQSHRHPADSVPPSSWVSWTVPCTPNSRRFASYWGCCSSSLPSQTPIGPPRVQTGQGWTSILDCGAVVLTRLVVDKCVPTLLTIPVEVRTDLWMTYYDILNPKQNRLNLGDIFIFQMHFVEWKLLCIKSNFTQV